MKGNNRTYEVLNERFAAMRPHFIENRFRVINCTPDSGLQAFEMGTYEKALAYATGPAEMDTTGWYHNLVKGDNTPPIVAANPKAPSGPAPMGHADMKHMFAEGMQELMEKMGVLGDS